MIRTLYRVMHMNTLHNNINSSHAISPFNATQNTPDDSQSAVYLWRKDNNKPHADLTLPSSVVPTLGPDVKDTLCILVYRKIISATLAK